MRRYTERHILSCPVVLDKVRRDSETQMVKNSKARATKFTAPLPLTISETVLLRVDIPTECVSRQP